MAGLALLTLLSVVPFAKPTPPVLTTQLFSQQVQFTTWNTVLGPGGPCNLPFIVVVYFLNFTVNLSGRDPGSTWVKFQSNNTSTNTSGFPEMFLYSAQDLASINQPLCQLASGGGGNIVTPYEANLQPTLSTVYWRPLQSGVYSVLIRAVSSFGNFTPPFSAVDTWTVTTLS